MKRYFNRKKKKTREKRKKLSHLKKSNSNRTNMHRHRLSRPNITYITIFESEFEFIAAQPNAWDNLETGGELYGFLSHDGNLIIMFATPPGKNAIHHHTRFKQDYLFFQKTSLLLFKYFSLLYIGNWHSHHCLGLKSLSKPDIRNLNKIARKNNFNRLTQFLITFEKNSQTASLHPSNKSSADNNNKRLTMINSYFYPDAMNGCPVKCPIKILPGDSPIRQAVENNSNMKFDLITPYKNTKDHILYDEYKTVPPKKDQRLPKFIQTQVELFIKKNNQPITITVDGRFIIIQVILFKDLGSLFIVYDVHTPSVIHSVFYQIEMISKKAINITDEILVNNQAKIDLRTTYSLCKKLVIKQFYKANILK